MTCYTLLLTVGVHYHEYIDICIWQLLPDNCGSRFSTIFCSLDD